MMDDKGNDGDSSVDNKEDGAKDDGSVEQRHCGQIVAG